jgi:hypothetical protein
MTYTKSLEAGGGQPLGQQDIACFRKRKSQLNYMDIRKIMDKRLAQQKKGLLTDAEIKKLVTEWQDERGEEDLKQATIDREVRAMDKYTQLPCRTSHVARLLSSKNYSRRDHIGI